MLLVHEISLKEEVNVNDLIKRLHWFDVQTKCRGNELVVFKCLSGVVQ